MSDTVRDSVNVEECTHSRLNAVCKPRRMLFVILCHDPQQTTLGKQFSCVKIVEGFSQATQSVLDLQAAAQRDGLHHVDFWWQYIRWPKLP
jgi:hypothetical protein